MYVCMCAFDGLVYVYVYVYVCFCVCVFFFRRVTPKQTALVWLFCSFFYWRVWLCLVS